jgi:hypothetical protein
MIQVYLLANIETSKSYVGITSRGAYGNGILVSHAKKKYGASAFYPTILCSTDDKQTADKLERFYISLFNTLHPNGYNLALGGDGGAIHTPEIKKKMSDSLKKTHSEHPEIALGISKKLKGRVSPNKGMIMPESTKSKISASLLKTEFRHTEAHKLKMSEIGKNRRHSPETKLKMSLSAKARVSTPEGIERMRKASQIALEKRT